MGGRAHHDGIEDLYLLSSAFLLCFACGVFRSNFKSLVSWHNVGPRSDFDFAAHLRFAAWSSCIALRTPPQLCAVQDLLGIKLPGACHEAMQQ